MKTVINQKRAKALVKLTDKAYWALRELITELTEQHNFELSDAAILDLEHTIERVLTIETDTRDQAGLGETDEEAE